MSDFWLVIVLVIIIVAIMASWAHFDEIVDYIARRRHEKRKREDFLLRFFAHAAKELGDDKVDYILSTSPYGREIEAITKAIYESKRKRGEVTTKLKAYAEDGSWYVFRFEWPESGGPPNLLLVDKGHVNE